ncbi:MAG: hypothetical protein JWQ71_2171 [Pedosphaera sp.]|nr:hypothetical protein [Pedosphaera sp.]
MSARTFFCPALKKPSPLKRWRLLILSGLLLLPFETSAQQAVTTLAGSVFITGSVDGPATNALFNDPAGLAIDANGNIYVADSQNHTLRKLSAGGIVTTLAGKAGQFGSANGTGTNASFNTPSGIALGGDSTLYVTDTGNHTIRRVTTNGVVSTLAGFAGQSGITNATGSLARFNTPLGIAVDQSGILYVADSGNHTIRKVTSAGVVTKLAGSAEVWGSTDGTGGAALFNGPVGIAIDSKQNIYVSDSNNQTIRKVTTAGVVTTWAGQAGVDGATDGIGSAALFSKPAELKIDRNDNLFVLDSFNHTIRRITTNAVVTTLAGLPGNGGATDGFAGAARFFNPYGLAIDRNGNLRVSDTYNQTIRFVYQPITASLVRDGGNLIISWQAAAGNKYQVQSKQETDGAAWQNLGAIVTATNSVGTQADNLPPALGQRFYRVMLLP